jgi:hypothetical protein
VRRHPNLQLLGSLLVALAIVAVVILVVSTRLSSIPGDQLEHGGDNHGESGGGHGRR